MDIKQEEFDKLKQLDRIEYRQRKEVIKKNNNPFSGFFILTLLFFLSTVLLLLTPQMILVDSLNDTNELERIRILYSSAIIIMFFLFILGCIVDIKVIIKRNNMLKELRKEYFKVEVKK